MIANIIRFSIAALILSFPPGRAWSADRPLLNWVIFEQAPYFIDQGSLKGQGVGDRLLEKLMDALPAYEHVVKMANVNRYNVEVVKPNTCAPVAWLSHIEKGMLHSKAHSIEPPMGVFTLKSRQQYFGPPERTLSLSKLLENGNLVLGAISGMLYGPRVEALLKKYASEENVYMFNPGQVELNLKLIGSRVDYLLGIRSQSLYESIKGRPNPYQFYNIQEIDNYVDLFAHCSDDNVGRKAIKVIDSLLTKDLLRDMLAEYENWYGKNDQYREIFMQHIIDQVPHPLVQRVF